VEFTTRVLVATSTLLCAVGCGPCAGLAVGAHAQGPRLRGAREARTQDGERGGSRGSRAGRLRVGLQNRDGPGKHITAVSDRRPP
jgi:hypothetical protein